MIEITGLLTIASILFAIGWMLIGASLFIIIHIKNNDLTTNHLGLIILFGILGPLTLLAWLCALIIDRVLESDFVNGVSNPKILIKCQKK